MQAESYFSSLISSLLWRGLARVLGFLKHLLIAAAIGLSAQLDVFYMGLSILGVLLFSWGRVLEVLAVPPLVQSWKARLPAFSSLARRLLTLSLLVSGVLTVLILFAAPQLASFAVGFDATRHVLLSEALRWFLPAILFCLPLYFLYSVLRAMRQFSVEAQTECLIAALILVFVFFFRTQPWVLFGSFSAAFTLAFLYALFKTRKAVLPLSSPFKHEIGTLFRTAPGLFILQGSVYLYAFSDALFLSFLPLGAVAALSYGMLLIHVFPNILGLSRGFLTVLLEEKDRAVRNVQLNDLISLAIWLSIGIMGFMLLQSSQWVAVLLERGRFTAADTQRVADIVVFGSALLLPLFLIDPIERIFQAEKTITPIVQREIVGLIVNLSLNACFLALGWGARGIVCATVVAYWVMVCLALLNLKKWGYRIAWQRHACWGVWLVGGVLPAAFVLQALPAMPAIASVIVVAVSLGVSLLLSGWCYPGPEKQLFQQTVHRGLQGLALKQRLKETSR